jgi:hypothetical protein
MRTKAIMPFIIALLTSSVVQGQSAFVEEEFTEDDFAQFFSLIEGGKISKEKMSERCNEQSIGFTFAGRDIRHENGPERIFYNNSRENTSVDDRTLRAKHSNASFGEWTGAVFKPLCPGLYSLSVDFSAQSEAGKKATDVYVHVYLKRAGEERPGQKIVTAIKNAPGSRGSGHATLALPLRSGDEISTWSEGAGPDAPRVIEYVTLTAIKVVHLENLVEEIDMEAWTRDVAMLKREN